MAIENITLALFKMQLIIEFYFFQKAAHISSRQQTGGYIDSDFDGLWRN